MKQVSKQMQEVLKEMGYKGDDGLAVVEDRTSRTIGRDTASTSVIKMLLDAFDAKLQTVGLDLVNACVNWKTDESPEQIYKKLRQMQLITEDISV